MAPPYLSGLKNVRTRLFKPTGTANDKHKLRVSKPNQQRGKGRPIEYSKGLIKKLLLLRLCGLTNHEIIRLLDPERNTIRGASVRTLQDFVKTTLGEPKERYGGPSRLVAREQRTILKSLLKASDNELSRLKKTRRVTRASRPLQSSDSTLQSRAEESLDAETRQSVVVGSIKSSENLRRLSLVCSQTSGSIRLSISSSLLRAINRFSRSTWSSTSTASMHALHYPPPFESARPLNSGRPQLASDIVSGRAWFLKRAKVALDLKCCGKFYPNQATAANTDQPLCLHLRILLYMRAESEDEDMHWKDIENSLRVAELRQTPLDACGNSELFFATRVGAPVCVLLLLIQKRRDLEATNEDGRTFLFFLNPLSFKYSHSCNCRRAFLDRHQSPLECLFRELASLHFNFSHVDHHGLSFLPYFFAESEFDKELLLKLFNLDADMRGRLAETEYLSDPNAWSLECIRRLLDAGYCLPYFAESVQGQAGHRIYSERTQLQQYAQTRLICVETFYPLPFDARPIEDSYNNYSIYGHTPMMEFILEAMDKDMPSPHVCEKLRELLNNHANINARSRRPDISGCYPGGQTVLHLVAGKARPTIVEFLLRHGVQKDHRDDEGQSAYDYAWRLFQQSRKRNAPALQAARSFQSLVVFNKNPKNPNKEIQQRSDEVCKMLDPVQHGINCQVWPSA